MNSNGLDDYTTPFFAKLYRRDPLRSSLAAYNWPRPSFGPLVTAAFLSRFEENFPLPSSFLSFSLSSSFSHRRRQVLITDSAVPDLNALLNSTGDGRRESFGVFPLPGGRGSFLLASFHGF